MLDADSSALNIYSCYGADPALGSLVALFVDEMPARAAKLQTEAAQGDWALVGRTAHALKGAAGTYGFDQFTAPAERLCHAIRDGRGEAELLRLVAELVSLCQRARAGRSAAE